MAESDDAKTQGSKKSKIINNNYVYEKEKYSPIHTTKTEEATKQSIKSLITVTDAVTGTIDVTPEYYYNYIYAVKKIIRRKIYK